MPRSGFKCKIFPNGEFSIGYVSDRRMEPYPPTDPNAFRFGSLWWAHVPELRRWVEDRVVQGAYDAPDLDLSVPPNYHKRRGLKGITSRGGRLVRNVAHMLQARYTRYRLSFLTLTVPPLLPSEEARLCGDWSRVVRVFSQRLKRMLDDAGLPAGYVGVTEVQEKRWNERQEVGLHLHYVFVGRASAKDDWAIAPREFRQAWLSVLSLVVGREVYSTSCENLKMVRKSASGYLGKYLSKGVTIVNDIVEVKGESFIPTAWYTCAMGLKRAYHSSIAVHWDEDLNIVSRLPLLSTSGAIERCGLTFIQLGGREVLVGIAGKFNMYKLANLDVRLAESVRAPSAHSMKHTAEW